MLFSPPDTSTTRHHFHFGWTYSFFPELFLSSSPIASVQFSSVTQSCPTLCDSMGCSTPGFLVHHHLPELAQTHVHCVDDAIEPSHPLPFPSPPTFNLSQHQGLFQWVVSSNQVAKVFSHQVAKVSEFQLQSQSYQSPIAHWTPIDLSASSISDIFFCLCIWFVGFSVKECLSGLSFPSSVDHVLSELSIMTCPSRVALHSMAHSFIELHRAPNLLQWLQLKSQRHLLLGRKSVTNLENILKSKHYFADKDPSSQSYGFSSSHYGCELGHKESWALKNWYFPTVVLGKTLESPLDNKELKSVHLKERQSWIFIGRTGAKAESPILWPPDTKSQLIGKYLDAGKDWGQEEKRATEDEMVGWHQCLVGLEFEQAPGDGERQGSLACCRPWDCKELD